MEERPNHKETAMSLSFTKDIRPLFTDMDIEHMAYYAQLDDYEDVKAEAENIYTRLADKTMPPDDPWSDDDIASFKQWIEDGCLP